jgi:predicted nucleotidyltransferase
LAYTSVLPFSQYYTERARKPELRKQELVMLLDDLRVKKDAIVALGHEFGARHIRVFGSVARYEERPDSDIDFLVEFPRGYDLFSQRLPLAERLGRLLNRHVDLVPEHELNRHIREQVLSEAVEL